MGHYEHATGEDLQDAVRDLQDYLSVYWRWTNFAENPSDPIEEKFTGTALIRKMQAVGGIVREFQRREVEEPHEGWDIG